MKRIDLSGFTGSENFYRHWLGLVYTEGVRYLAEQAGAFWLIDAIASHQPKAMRDRMLRDFQIWRLTPDGTGRAMLTCWRDSGPGEKPVITQHIEFTDFPFDAMEGREITLYVENQTICLPSER